jgi:hypothetical protein
MEGLVLIGNSLPQPHCEYFKDGHVCMGAGAGDYVAGACSAGALFLGRQRDC